MASGYFPVGNSNPETGAKLEEAKRLVGEVIEHMSETCMMQDQTDNAFDDGGHIELLHLAQYLISGRM